jgi:hypothetical protein
MDLGDVFKIAAGVGALSVQVRRRARGAALLAGRHRRLRLGAKGRQPAPGADTAAAAAAAAPHRPQVDVVSAWSGNSRTNLDVMVALVSNSSGKPALLGSAIRSAAPASPALLASLQATLSYDITTPGT